MLGAPAGRSENNVAGHAILAVGASRIFVNGLNHEGLGVGVIVALFFELELAFGELLNNLIGGNFGGIGRKRRLRGRLMRRAWWVRARLRQGRRSRRGVAGGRRQWTGLLGGKRQRQEQRG